MDNNTNVDDNENIGIIISVSTLSFILITLAAFNLIHKYYILKIQRGERRERGERRDERDEILRLIPPKYSMFNEEEREEPPVYSLNI